MKKKPTEPNQLIMANKELAIHDKEKEKWAADLIAVNVELAFEHEEKEKRGSELLIANLELALQSKEKEKRGAELIIANIELIYQNEEKEKRAAELLIANRELCFQNEEKEKRAAELRIANVELAFQNTEKEKRAAELINISSELAFQKEEKEKRAAELIASTIADLTERKKDEEYIGHLAAIVESSDNAIISKSLDGIIKSWNRASEKMFGYTTQQAIGKHISLIIPDKYLGEERIFLEKIRNNEIIDHYETVRRKKNGDQFYVSLTVSPLKDRAGNIIGISKIASDITSRKKNEKELISLNEELVFQNEEK